MYLRHIICIMIRSRRVIDLDRINRQWIYYHIPRGCNENHCNIFSQKQKQNNFKYTHAVGNTTYVIILYLWWWACNCKYSVNKYYRHVYTILYSYLSTIYQLNRVTNVLTPEYSILFYGYTTNGLLHFIKKKKIIRR